MIKNIIRKFLDSIGYEIRKKQFATKEEKGHFVLYRYLNEDGSFNYEKYKKIQEKGNIEKTKNVWVKEENIAFLSNYINEHIDSPLFGLCHGTRRGKEQEWFRQYLGCDVIGTEISKTAEDFPHTIQWDFHDTKAEWINALDFIYSNSFDHSYNPEKCLNAWMSCLKKGGLCFLEHSSLHSDTGATELDPFGAHIIVMPYLITLWGKGKYSVREIIKAPRKDEDLKYLDFIVIQKH